MSESTLSRSYPTSSRAGRARSLAPALACALGLSALAQGPRPARAAPDRFELVMELNTYVLAVIYVRDDGESVRGRFRSSEADCLAVVDALKATGMPPGEQIDGRAPYYFRQAPALCHEYGTWKVLADATNAVQDVIDELAMARSMEIGVTSARSHEIYAEQPSRCAAAIASAHAAGLTDATALHTEPPMTLGAVATNVCEPFVTWIREFGAANDKVWSDREQAARARYAPHGAAGKRLELLMFRDPEGRGAEWLVPGCRWVSDPRRLAKAPVLSYLLGEYGGFTTIRRLQFKGNKLVSDTRKEYLTQGLAMDTGCR